MDPLQKLQLKIVLLNENKFQVEIFQSISLLILTQHPYVHFVSNLDQKRAICLEFLYNLLNSNLTPTICSLTHDKKGQLLNTNADTIASEIAIAMSKYYNVTLKYCFDKSGVLMDQNSNTSIKKNITKKEFKKLVDDKIINDGMIPKLENCFHALENGVNKIYIGDLDILNTIKHCTKITL